jgi:hypothetical protein
MYAKRCFAIALLAVLLSACQPAATPQPTLQPLRVQLTPLLAGSWQPKLSACSSYLTQSNLLIDVREASQLDLQAANLVIRTSSYDIEAVPEGTYLGPERLSLVVNPQNPIISLTPDETGALLAGSYAQWNEVPSLAATSLTFDQPVKQIALVDQELSAFLAAAFPTLNISPLEDEKTYSVEMAQQRVAETPGAFGLLPASSLTPTLKQVQLLGPDGKALTWQLQVVALTPVEPKGDVLQLLLCLQNPSQP